MTIHWRDKQVVSHTTAESRRFVVITPTGQMPLLEERSGKWIVWLDYDPERTHGTFVLLGKDGEAKRCTITQDGKIRDMATIMPKRRKQKRGVLTKDSE